MYTGVRKAKIRPNFKQFVGAAPEIYRAARLANKSVLFHCLSVWRAFVLCLKVVEIVVALVTLQ